MAENKHFHDYLAPDNILCRVEIADRNDALRILLGTLKRHYPAVDVAVAFREVVAREELFPTVIAPGLAVPHARIPGISAPLVALATSTSEVDFNSELGKVRMVVLILSPLDDPSSHMQLISALATVFAVPGTVEKIAGFRTPVEVWNCLSGGAMPDYLKAADVMRPNPVTLHETDSLQEAIGLFAGARAEELVVIDRAGDLRGVLALDDLLSFSLPEHLLWLEDLSPVYRFQPFAEMLKAAGDTKVADVMREEFIKVDRDVPAIQLAKLFLVHKVRQLVITGTGGKLAGVVVLKEFCAKLFWE